MTTKLKAVVSGATIFLSGAAASPALAGDFTTYTMGNSLSGDLEYHFRSFANAYEVKQGSTYHWGQQFRPSTTLTYLHDNPTDAGLDSKGNPFDQVTQSAIGLDYTQGLPSNANSTRESKWDKALPENKWDAVIFEPYRSTAGAEAPYVCTLGSDRALINDMIAKTRGAPGGVNASTRFFLYAAWPDWAYTEAPYTNAKYQSNFTATTENKPDQPGLLSRGYYQHLYNNVHADNPDVSISVIPVGEVFYAVSLLMDQGKLNASNLTSIQQLYRDGFHANFLGQDVIAWTAYATIFKSTPVGLDAGPSGLINSSPDINNGYTDLQTSSLTVEDKRLIQQTIWDVVTGNSAYTNVPEPKSLGVLSLSGLSLLRRRRV